VHVRLPPTEYERYASAWDAIALDGLRELNLDAWAAGQRYLSLTAVCLSPSEAAELAHIAGAFAPLLDLAVQGILDDPDWWSALAWPHAALELARQEAPHPAGRVSLFGRLDCLLDAEGHWQVIEYNADTPSGAREACGLEPGVRRLYPGTRCLSTSLARQLVATLCARLPDQVRCVGVVSSHSWLEDMSEATWLADRLRRAGTPTLVGDVTDLAVGRGGRIMLRGEPLEALYRFYPIERLYRHAIFTSLEEAALDGQLVLLNGLRGFLAQSKACLAWLWSNRMSLSVAERALIERHLPPTVLLRSTEADSLRADGVVKHVNGREGDSVVFSRGLDDAAWEARLLEGGYVIQRAVASPALADVDVDDWQGRVARLEPRYACVGAFVVGGQFAGCYTRLDGPITSHRATYVATLVEHAPAPRR
jgi:glutathionylspermidine synthase